MTGEQSGGDVSDFFIRSGIVLLALGAGAIQQSFLPRAIFGTILIAVLLETTISLLRRPLRNATDQSMGTHPENSETGER